MRKNVLHYILSALVYTRGWRLADGLKDTPREERAWTAWSLHSPLDLTLPGCVVYCNLSNYEDEKF
jgi:hypothetical protein